MKENSGIYSNFPKVLLINKYYGINEGAGITINNLFDKWPIENFAIAAEYLYIDKSVKWNNFYQFGSYDVVKHFPYSVLSKDNSKFGALNKNEIISNNLNSSNPINQLKKKNNIYDIFEKVIRKIMTIIGVQEFCEDSYRISDEFIQFLNTYKPNVLYVHPTNRQTAKFALKIQEILNIPMILHIMDDYQKRSKPSLLYYFWEYQNNKMYKKLVEKSELHFSISDGMADEFISRFGVKFHPFHNPVDIDKMNYYKSVANKNNIDFRILQVGNINTWRSNAILNVCKTITSINQYSEKKVSIDIFAQNIYNNPSLYKLFSKFKAVTINKPIDHEEMLKLLSNYDLILLACNFDKNAIKYIHLSYSTNTSEFMASGVPILVYGPEQLKYVADAKNNQWAYSITEESCVKLENHIFKLVLDSTPCNQIIKNAINTAKKRSEINLVQSNLKKLITSILIR